MAVLEVLEVTDHSCPGDLGGSDDCSGGQEVLDHDYSRDLVG